MQKVQCTICPYDCKLVEGATGVCLARRNIGGKIVPLAYAKPCSIAMDPMEKKPLYHFFPGSPILSLGMAGCNLRCQNCQNASISQVNPESIPYQTLTAENLVQVMQQHHVKHVAYTYTEPLVAYEYILDCAKAVHEAGFYNVLVSAAYIHLKPLEELLPYLDAANIDLKGMSESFYWENSKAHLQPILEALKAFAKSSCSLEVTNLLIPGLNDQESEIRALTDFVAQELGEETPLHFSRFFPQYKMQHVPMTPIDTILQAMNIAYESHLKHVYMGNVNSEEITRCTQCSRPLIVRQGYTIKKNILQNGKCPFCGKPLYGRY